MFRYLTAIVLAAAALGGCQKISPESSLPADHACGADYVAVWLGALLTDAAKTAIDKAIGDRTVRIYTEGDPVTMDYSPQRLNVVLGEDGRIRKFRCG